MIYFALDKNGEKATNPFKASLFGKHAGLSALQSHFLKCKEAPAETKEETKIIISQAFAIAQSEKDFKAYLIEHGINVVIRRNQHGRLYGISFVDHNTRTVYNGSHLGKQYSTNAIDEIFLRSNNSLVTNGIEFPQKSDTSRPVIPHKDTLLFDFMLNNECNFDDWGILNDFLLFGSAEDPEKQLFEFNMKKKKRRQNKR